MKVQLLDILFPPPTPRLSKHFLLEMRRPIMKVQLLDLPPPSPGKLCSYQHPLLRKSNP